jgi:hypothetical protein
VHDAQTIKLTALVTEVHDGGGLAFIYKALLPRKQAAAVYLLPGFLTKRILLSSGLVVCDSLDHTSNPSYVNHQELALPCALVQSGWRVSVDKLPYQMGLACVLWTRLKNDDVARCVVLEMARQKRAEVFIMGDVCLGCCTKKALKVRVRPGATKGIVYIV